MSEMGQRTFPEVWDRSEDSRSGPRWVGGPSGRFGMCRGTLGEV